MANEIFIENLPSKVDASMLINMFKREGRIISCKIHVDKHFASLGKGCICFDNPSSAKNAIDKIDGEVFHGRKIKVSLNHGNDEENKTKTEHYTKIHVKNIPPSWDDCDLMMEFGKFGEIGTAQVSVTDGKSNCYGFVIFNKHSSAKAAVMSKYPNLVVNPFIPKPLRSTTMSMDKVTDILKQSTQYNNLHIKNIPEDMDDSDLEEMFEKFGNTTSVKVARDKNSGKSLGYGFVCFDSEIDAEEARSAMNGHMLKSKPLIVNFHQKKEARQQYLEKKRSVSRNHGEKHNRETYFEKRIGGQKKEKDIPAKEKNVERKGRDNIKKEACAQKSKVLFSFSCL